MSSKSRRDKYSSSRSRLLRVPELWEVEREAEPPPDPLDVCWTGLELDAAVVVEEVTELPPVPVPRATRSFSAAARKEKGRAATLAKSMEATTKTEAILI